MIETAQFYGYEDWGACFKNVHEKDAVELIAHRPMTEQPACIIDMNYAPRVLPGAMRRAVARWAKSRKFAATDNPNAWRSDDGLTLTFELKPRRAGRGRLRVTLARL